MSGESPVLYSVDGPVATVSINRPERRNALNPECLRLIDGFLGQAEADDSVHALVITGAGDKAFCAGADLGGLGESGRVAQHFERAEIGRLFHKMTAPRLPISAREN